MATSQKSGIDTEDKEAMDHNINILSFDGGGTKGCIEVFVFDLVMRFATLVQRNDERIRFMFNEFGLSTEGRRRQLVELLESLDPSTCIHPNQVFDVFVGTSAGSLVAFYSALGPSSADEKKTSAPDLGFREPQQLKEIFIKNADHLFEKRSKNHGYLQGMLSIAYPNAIPYSREGIYKVLTETFGEMTLGDAFKKQNRKLIGGVAMGFPRSNTVIHDELEIFDTQNPKFQNLRVKDVIMASSDPPIIFESPTMLPVGKDGEMVPYIDGGIGGNCPLVQAIPRARAVFGPNSIGYVFSIAPSSSYLKITSTYPEHDFLRQMKFWAKYFLGNVTSGDTVYERTRRLCQSGDPLMVFQRLTIEGNRLYKYRFWSKEVRTMLNDARLVAIEESEFLLDVLLSGVMIAFKASERSHYFRDRDEKEFRAFVDRINQIVLLCVKSFERLRLFSKIHNCQEIMRFVLRRARDRTDDLQASRGEVDLQRKSSSLGDDVMASGSSDVRCVNSVIEMETESSKPSSRQSDPLDIRNLTAKFKKTKNKNSEEDLLVRNKVRGAANKTRSNNSRPKDKKEKKNETLLDYFGF